MTARGQWVTGWLGLALIVTTGVLVPVSTAFPGVVALLPVTGAVLILLSGHLGRGSAAALLSARPLVSLGGVAYAIYLWHWPVLVFYLHYRGVDQAGLVGGLLVLGTSIALAYASTLFIERPIRQLRWERPGEWLAPAVGVSATLLLVATAGGVSASSAPTMPASDDVRLAHWAEPGARADFTVPPSDSPYPGVAAAAKDRPTMVVDGCNQKVREPDLLTCTYGDPDAARTMLLVGGSHSAHWQPALHEIGVQLGWRLETMTKSGCRQGLSMVGPEYNLYDDDAITDSCRAWDEEMLSLILADPPDLVVATTTAASREGEQLPLYYEKFWRELDQHDVAMLGIRGTPRAPTNRVDCVAEHGAGSPECDYPRSEALAEVNPAAELAAELGGLTVADLTDWICSDTICSPIVEDTFVYHDRHHLTTTFSRALAQPLFREVPHIFE